MAAFISSNATILLHNAANGATPGILLNPHSHSSLSREPRQSSSFASSSSSASQTSNSHSNSHSRSSNDGEGPSRKIRFAPLPAPRRDDLPSVFDDSDSDSALAPSRQTSDAPFPPQSSGRSSSVSTTHSDDTPKSRSRAWGRKLLRPLLHPLLPSAANSSEESYAPLFRVSSRESPKVSRDLPEDSCGGAPLSRRMSTGSRAISTTKEAERSHIYRDGAPLAPVMSEGFSSKGRKDGQRMLNGRVYGRRPASHNGNTTLNEPEFVEWGYGGMGSVASGSKSRSGPDWAKLQSNDKVLGGGDEFDEGNDGSGMGWVKRRRAERERQKQETEEREKGIQNDAIPGVNVSPPESKEDRDSPRPPSHSENSEPKLEEHHIYRAVSIPAPYHHHSRHLSRGDGSGSATPTSMLSLSRAGSSSSVPLLRTASAGSHGETLPAMPESTEDKEASSGSSVASSAASIDEDYEDVNDTERESDDDGDDAEGRLTSKGAGVEKISRHKE